MLDFRRADAVRQRAEGAMGGGVAVAADDGRAGKRKTLFGADDVDDALAAVVLVEIFDAEFAGVGGELARPGPDSGSSIGLARSVVGTL